MDPAIFIEGEEGWRKKLDFGIDKKKLDYMAGFRKGGKIKDGIIGTQRGITLNHKGEDRGKGQRVGRSK